MSSIGKYNANNVTEIDAIDKVNTTLELFTFKDTKNGFINIMMRSDISGMNRTFPLTTLGKYIEINASRI